MKKSGKGTIAAKLKESEVRYRRLFETAHDGILILDSETGQITDVNPFLEKLLGYSRTEFLNKKLWEVGAFRNMKASKDAFMILQKEGYLRYEDLPLETKDGKLISVEFVSNSYIAGGTLVIQCNIRDITERKRVDLIKDTQRLLEEEKSKVDLAMQSAKKNKKPAKSALRAINYEIKHLSNILSDLSLITSKAWELKNRVVYENISLKSFIKIVVGRCKPLAYKKNISITSDKIPNITVLGDEIYLEKMLVNLVKNSIVYGKKGGNTKISAKKSKGLVVISVADNGIGILKEDLPHVFERFYRADRSHGSDRDSIGLGLAIVKWVAELHGGEVSVKSTKNKGSIFYVSLPIKGVKKR